MNQNVQLYDRIPLEESASDHENILDAVTQYFDERPEVESFANTDVQ